MVGVELLPMSTTRLFAQVQIARGKRMRRRVQIDVRRNGRALVAGLASRPRFTRRVSPLEEIRVPLGPTGWHLVSLDTPTLPEVNGRHEGARLIAYALG